MFILSNIAMILWLILVNKTEEGSILAIWIVSVASFIEFASLNAAHWMFSFEYYNMVRIIPYVLDDSSPPESIVRSNRAQFWFWLVLNIVVAFLFGCANYFMYVSEKYVKNDMKTYHIATSSTTIFYLILSLLSVISGTYLGLSIHRIKKLITQKEDLINTKIMTI